MSFKKSKEKIKDAPIPSVPIDMIAGMLVDNIIDSYNDVFKKNEIIKKELQLLQGMENDILHELEFHSFNAVEGYHYAKMLADIRIKRRQWKNLQKYIGKLFVYCRDKEHIIKSIKKDIINTKKKIEELTYNVRSLEDLKVGKVDK